MFGEDFNMQKKQNINFRTIVSAFCLIFFIFLQTACSGSSDAEQDGDLDLSTTLIPEISASGEVVPVKWATLSFTNLAKDIEVLVSEGDQVSKGDPLVRNNAGQLQTALLQAQAAYKRAQFAYTQTLNSPSPAALESANATLISARINLEEKEDFGFSQNQIDIAQANFDAAMANYITINAGASTEEVTAAEYELEAAQIALEDAEAAFTLNAPFDGKVAEVYVNSGEAIGALQPVLVLADLSNLQVVTTDLSEIDVAFLEVGQRANINFDAISDQTFTASIEDIADKSTGVSSVYYEVILKLDNVPANLRWGMTAFITFPVE